MDFGDFRRLVPISKNWGYDRGLPIDRYYIEQFLASHNDDIAGRVLEIGENVYTLKFGGDRVSRSDILHVSGDHPQTTFLADLAEAEIVPSGAFDCVICTQTIQVIPEKERAVATLYRILKPGGVLLATFPGISMVYRDPENRWEDLWHFTSTGVQWLLETCFPGEQIHIRSYGNVMSAVAFLEGLGKEELDSAELDALDRDFQILIAARARKPEI